MFTHFISQLICKCAYGFRTLAELMLPDGAHLRENDWTLFFLNQRSQGRTEKDKPLLFALNLVRTKHDATQRRGAKMMAMAVASRHHFIHIYKVRSH
jgi:hypothetical protein